jgi:sugar phosphate permease
LPVIVPQLREEYDLSLGQIGLLLAASWIGTTLTLLPWGLAADRFGERTVLTAGMLGSALFLVGAAFAPGYVELIVLLLLVGAAGAAVNSSSGRAVMHWFGPDERGLALGVRQTAIPLGGLVGALSLPLLADAGGSEAAFLFLAALIGAGALVGAVVLRGRENEDGIEPASVGRTIVDAKLWRLSIGSGLYLYAQIAVLGFGVLFLVDEHDFSEQSAALVFAGGQALAMASRIGAGRWSDVMRTRVVPLRRIGLAIVGAMVVTAALAGGPIALLVPVLVLACGLTMAWNGLSFTAAAELAGPFRSGAAIGVQQTVLSLVGVAAPVLFAVCVAQASWPLAFAAAALFPLVGWAVLRPLRTY